jgi:ABC-type lipoprotein release transport system permease subunit
MLKNPLLSAEDHDILLILVVVVMMIMVMMMVVVVMMVMMDVSQTSENCPQYN